MDRYTARGYIASGPFKNNRIPQHIQNAIIKGYCDDNKMNFILSRAEYSIGKDSQCQLWAALNEGNKNVVFYSVWQLPQDIEIRHKIFRHCLTKEICLHFAVERIRIDNIDAVADVELLIQVYDSIDNTNKKEAYYSKFCNSEALMNYD